MSTDGGSGFCSEGQVLECQLSRLSPSTGLCGFCSPPRFYENIWKHQRQDCGPAIIIIFSRSEPVQVDPRLIWVQVLVEENQNATVHRRHAEIRGGGRLEVQTRHHMLFKSFLPLIPDQMVLVLVLGSLKFSPVMIFFFNQF